MTDAATSGVRTLTIDIGGTGIKMMTLDANGRPLSERLRELTPRPATPGAVFAVIRKIIGAQGDFERVSVGFPGVVVRGVVRTAPNLDDKAWPNLKLQDKIAQYTQKPTRVINDADLQGDGAIAGRGVALVLTLGTGLGSALYIDGLLVPNLELGHHPFQDGARRRRQRVATEDAAPSEGSCLRKRQGAGRRHPVMAAPAADLTDTPAPDQRE